jgi:hypothetical protein
VATAVSFAEVFAMNGKKGGESRLVLVCSSEHVVAKCCMSEEQAVK